MSDYDYTYLSFGAGVQSTALLVLSALEQRGVPKVDAAIFADTGDEPQYIYDYLEIVKPWAEDHGIPFHVVSAGKLSEAALRKEGRAPSMPFWTRGSDGREAPLMRQCTRDYKVVPIQKKVRELLGYQPRQRIKEKVRCLLGISLDEVSRVKPNRERWITNEWPLIDAHLHRQLCGEIVTEAGLPAPKKSSCVYCPYHSNAFYRELKEDYPVEFEKACKFDDAIRDPDGRYRKSLDNPPFIHRSLQPLRNVDFTDSQQNLFGFDNECEGYCGI